MLLHSDRKEIFVGCTALIALAIVMRLVASAVAPIDSTEGPSPRIFVVGQGESFRDIVHRLSEAGIVRPAFGFTTLAILRGVVADLKPGRYAFVHDARIPDVLETLVRGGTDEVTVTVPEGFSVYEIDDLLARADIIAPGSLVAAVSSGEYEGMLFPDTYNFFIGSNVQDVLKKFLDNFDHKAMPVLTSDIRNLRRNLTLASLIQKEVPDGHDAYIVAGILKKRFAAGMPLQVDATICYSKRRTSPGSQEGCLPITPLDFKIDSPYNTYLYKGWPPGPIGSPGLFALTAALRPESSPYWFYLSDPKTEKTIFAETLEGHAANRARYLR